MEQLRLKLSVVHTFGKIIIEVYTLGKKGPEVYTIAWIRCRKCIQKICMHFRSVFHRCMHFVKCTHLRVQAHWSVYNWIQCLGTRAAGNWRKCIHLFVSEVHTSEIEFRKCIHLKSNFGSAYTWNQNSEVHTPEIEFRKCIHLKSGCRKCIHLVCTLKQTRSPLHDVTPSTPG